MSQPNNPPSNPLPGAIYIDQITNLSWVWTGTFWIQAGQSQPYNTQIGTGATIVPGYYSKPGIEDWLPFVGSTAPITPACGQIWVDTSTSPYSSKVWDCNVGQFIELGGGPGSDTNSIVNSTRPSTRTNGNNLEVGDLWIDPATDHISYWNGGTWVLFSTPDTHSIPQSFQPLTRPNGENLEYGDLWVDTDTNTIHYYFGSGVFKPIVAVAENVLIGPTAPIQRSNGDPLLVSDLWTDTSNRATYYFDGTDWVPHNDTHSIYSTATPTLDSTRSLIEDGDQWYEPVNKALYVYDSTATPNWVKVNLDTHSYADVGDPLVLNYQPNRPNGAPWLAGDQYMDTSTNILWGFTGTTWTPLITPDTHSFVDVGDPNSTVPYNLGQRPDSSAAIVGDQYIDSGTNASYWWTGSAWKLFNKDTHSYVGNADPVANIRPDDNDPVLDGDLYVNDTDRTVFYRYGGLWKELPSDTHSFRQAVKPNTRPDGLPLKEGDMWVDTANGNTLYVYSSSILDFEPVSDKHSFFGNFPPNDALSPVNAGNRPSGTPLESGDQWFDGLNKSLYVWDGAVWQLAGPDTHTIRSAVAPFLTRPDGSSLQEGDLWVDTAHENTLYSYNLALSAWELVSSDKHSFAFNVPPTDVTSPVASGTRPNGNSLVVGDQYLDTNTGLLYAYVGAGTWVIVSGDTHSFSDNGNPNTHPTFGGGTGTRLDGSPLLNGDQYFDRTSQTLYVYDAGTWLVSVKDTHSMLGTIDPTGVQLTRYDGTPLLDGDRFINTTDLKEWFFDTTLGNWSLLPRDTHSFLGTGSPIGVKNTRDDGSPLANGDQYIDTVNDILYYYNSAVWEIASTDTHSFEGIGTPNFPTDPTPGTNPQYTRPNGSPLLEGDLYVDKSTEYLYHYDGGTWELITKDLHSFLGFSDPTGSVSTRPNGSNLVDGDQFIDKTTGAVYYYDTAANGGLGEWERAGVDTHCFLDSGDPNNNANFNGLTNLNTNVAFKDGDQYLDTANNVLYARTGANWVVISQDTHSFTGATNPNLVAQAAATIYYDLRPDGTLLEVGDLYVETTNNLLYYWDGANPNGSKWTVVSEDLHSFTSTGDPNLNTYNGLTHPTTGIAFKNGDHYVDTQTNLLYSRDGAIWDVISPDFHCFAQAGNPNTTVSQAPGNTYYDIREDSTPLVRGDQYIDTNTNLLYYWDGANPNGSKWTVVSEDTHAFTGTVDPNVAGSNVDSGLRPDGFSPLKDGDIYFNTSTNTQFYYNLGTTSWVSLASAVDTHSFAVSGDPNAVSQTAGTTYYDLRPSGTSLLLGDLYVDTSTNLVYYWDGTKANGSKWTLVSSDTHSYIDAGDPNGNTYNGVAHPTTTVLFKDGDQYLDNFTNILYSRVGAAWVAISGDTQSFVGSGTPYILTPAPGTLPKSLRDDGSALISGDQYIDTGTGILYYYNGSDWEQASDLHSYNGTVDPALAGSPVQATRPDGSALRVGDQYTNTTTETLWYWNTSWIKFDIERDTHSLIGAGTPYISVPVIGSNQQTTRDGVSEPLRSGDQYIDTNTGIVYYYTVGQDWLPFSDYTQSFTGAGTPFIATPAVGGAQKTNRDSFNTNLVVGDQFVDTGTNILYYYNGSEWEQIQDIHSYNGTVDPALVGSPVQTTRPDGTNLVTGDQYTNTTTGELWYWDSAGPSWSKYAGGSDTQGITGAGEPYLTGGTPKSTRDDGSALQKGDQYVDTNTGIAYYFTGNPGGDWVVFSGTNTYVLTDAGYPFIASPFPGGATAKSTRDGTGALVKGDLFINESTDGLFWYDGAEWKPTLDTHSILLGSNAPTPTTTRTGGLDVRNGDIVYAAPYNKLWIWDGSAWNPTADQHSFAGGGGPNADIGTGPNRPDTSPLNTGDQYFNLLTGDLSAFGFNASTWILPNTETGRIAQSGTPVANTVTLRGNGTALKAGDLYVDTSSGVVYIHNGTTTAPIENGWSEISRDSDVQLGAVSPPVVTTRSDGTDRKTGDLYINTVNGDIYYYDGVGWQLKPNSGSDTHSFTNTVHPTAVGSLVNAGNRPDGIPLLTGDRYFNSTSKELFVWDGSAWLLTGPIEHRSLNAAPTLRGNGIDSILEGDLWTSSTSSRTFIWDGSAWIPQNSFTFVQNTTPSASLTYTGDLWIDTNINRTFYWDGSAWIPQGSYNFVQDAQPAAAYERDVWIDTTDMTMYVYYNDGSTTSWTQIA